MHHTYAADHRHKHWMEFDAFLSASASTEHTRLVQRLAHFDALYLADIRIQDANDALRLLRVIDDLYQMPAPPVLYFTSAAPPDAWLRPSDAHSTLEKGIAEKFSRTTSRLYAMCEVEFIGPESAVA
jgi:cell division protein ZapE